MSSVNFFNYLNMLETEKDFSSFLNFLNEHKSDIYENKINTGLYTPKTNLIGFLISAKRTDILDEIQLNYPTEFKKAIDEVTKDIKEIFPFIFFHYGKGDLENKSENFENIVDIVRKLNKKEWLSILFENEHFISFFSLDEHPNFITYLKDIINLEDFIQIKDNEGESVFLNKFKNSEIQVKNIDFLEKVIDAIKNKEDDSIHISEKEKFLKNLASYKINKEVLILIKEKSKQYLNGISERLLFSALMNEKISSQNFLDIFNEDVEFLKNNDKNAFVSILHHALYIGKEDLALKFIKENPELIYNSNDFTEKPLWKIFFDDSELKEVCVYNSKSKWLDLLTSRSEPTGKERDEILSIILNKIQCITQEDADEILKSSITLSSYENFEKIYEKIDNLNLDINNFNLIYKKIEDLSIISFLKDKYLGLKYLPYITLNPKFIEFIKNNGDNEEKNKLLCVYFIEGVDRLNKDADGKLKDLIKLIDYIDIDLSVKHKVKGPVLNILLETIKEIKNSSSYRINLSYIDIKGKSVEYKEAVNIVENELYEKIEKLSLNDINTIDEETSYLSPLNILFEELRPDLLIKYLQKNIENLNLTNKIIKIVDDKLQEDPVSFTQIQALIISKSINLDKENINKQKRRL